MTQLVKCMGGVWRLSDRAYKKVLKQIVNNEDFDLDKEGKFIGDFAKDVTDMDAEEAQMILDDLKDSK